MLRGCGLVYGGKNKSRKLAPAAPLMLEVLFCQKQPISSFKKREPVLAFARSGWWSNYRWPAPEQSAIV